VGNNQFHKYLGNLITQDGNNIKEIKARVVRAKSRLWTEYKYSYKKTISQSVCMECPYTGQILGVINKIEEIHLERFEMWPPRGSC